MTACSRGPKVSYQRGRRGELAMTTTRGFDRAVGDKPTAARAMIGRHFSFMSIVSGEQKHFSQIPNLDEEPPPRPGDGASMQKEGPMSSDMGPRYFALSPRRRKCDTSAAAEKRVVTECLHLRRSRPRGPDSSRGHQARHRRHQLHRASIHRRHQPFPQWPRQIADLRRRIA